MTSRITKKQWVKASVAARQRSRPSTTDYKAIFLQQLHFAGLPAPETEVQFHAKRKWRLDYAWPAQQIAVEYQGGIYNAGRTGHSSVMGLSRDYEKFTEATLHGWRVILITAGSVRTGKAVEWVRRALEGSK